MAQRLTRGEKQALTRTALVEAAAHVFATKGFHAATVDEIAETAGYTVGALYSNFAGKEELLLATAQWYADRQTVRWAEAFEAAPNPQRAGPAVAWFESLAEQPEQFLLFMELWAHAARNPRLRPAFAQGWQSGRTFFADAVEKVAAESGISIDASTSADAVAALDALGIGLAVRRLVDPAGMPEELFVRLLSSLVPALLRATQDQ